MKWPGRRTGALSSTTPPGNPEQDCRIVTLRQPVVCMLLCGLVATASGQSSTGPLSIEERIVGGDRSGAASEAPATIGDEGLYLLMQEIRRLEEQVQQLHGRIEEIEHRRERDRNAERERYLDLDSRINALSEAVRATPEGVAGEPEKTPAEDAAPDDPEADRAAYMAGREKLLERDMDAARDAFDEYLERYPEGRFRAFAHFWLGEIHRSSAPPEPEKAAEHFRTVIDDHPDHSQVPSALYKLAELRAEAGERDEAREMLERVREEFSGSSEARMAVDMLEQLDR